MTQPQATAPCWSTASFGHDADTLPLELKLLSQHLNLCRHANGVRFLLRCHGEAVRTFLSARLVTTLLVGVVMMGGAASAML